MAARKVAAIPPLEQGASLSSNEFFRRYESMPELKKAELIDGIVHMGSPVSTSHARPDQILQTWTGVYVAKTPFLDAASNATLRFDGENVAQPDILVRVLEEFGGNCRINRDDYFEGPPELVIEIAATSASLDLNAKLKLYQRSRVPEYLVWRTLDAEVNWFALFDDRYKEIPPDKNRVIHSHQFPGLCLNVHALLAFDRVKVLETLESALRSAEYGAFLRRVKKKR